MKPKLTRLTILLCLVLLGLTLGATTVPAATTTSTTIEATELYHVSAPETLGGSAIKTDGAGHLFAAAVHYVGNDTRASVNEYAHDGTLLGDWSVKAPPVPSGYDKLDSVSLSASGTDLLIGMTSHLTSNRDYPLSVGKIPSVYVPYSGAQPEDGPGAYVPAPQAPTGLSDSDVARVASAVATIEAPQFQRVIDNIRPKVEGLFNGSAGSYIVWRQLTDTSYQGAYNALHPAPTATPHP